MRQYSSIYKQRGQLMILAMFGMIPLVLLIGFVFNTGEHVSSKVKTQNAADAAAITQATWAARSLNVMSINNTAMTQTYSITVVGLAVHSVIIEATKLIAEEQKEIADIFKFCASLSVGAALCAIYPAAREAHLLGNILPRYWRIAEDLGGGSFPQGLIAKKIYEFSDITQALSAMNEEVVKNFPEYTKNVSKEVARINSLTDVPRFYAGYIGSGIAKKEKYLTTGLPVRKIELINGIGQSLIGVATLKSTADKGTHRPPTSITQRYHNYKRHGYLTGKGPHIVARDQAKKAVDKLTGKDGLQRSPVPIVDGILPGPGVKVKKTFSKTEKPCWDFLASAQFLPLTCLQGAPIPRWPRLTIYELEEDFADKVVGNFVWSNADNLSIMAFVQRERYGSSVFPSKFTSPPNAEFAYAQAYIFNDKHPDLQTQYWRALLKPSTLLESSKKRAGALEAVKDFKEMHVFLSAFTIQQQKNLNAH